MSKGILVGFLSFALFALSDACVKALGGRVPVFEVAFFGCMFAALLTPLMRTPGESWIRALTPRRPKLVLLRALSGMLGGLFGIVAFTRLPFAEAYSIIFLAPSLITVLAVLALREKVTWLRWVPVVLGLGGVLLVVRPGFDQLVLAHLAALGVAVCNAATVLVLRAVAPVESRVSLLAWSFGLSGIITGLLMLPTFRWPSVGDFGLLAGVGLLSSAAQIGLMLATRLAPANGVGPTQYSQIAWAVLIGAVFFAEFPDNLALAGIGLVVVSGLLTLVIPSLERAKPAQLTDVRESA
ncbi:MAG TPA: DMT family transporter [Propylenella sp.]|nr:DMT family transporter [Propylenella sp.]